MTQQEAESEDIIVSIKPRFSRLIFLGEKTVELRRTIPRRIGRGSRVFFWESAPLKRLAGFAIVESVLVVETEILWRRVRDIAGISRTEFDEYFHGAEFGVAVFISAPREFEVKHDLRKLRRKLRFVPPQSFRYLSASEYAFLLKSPEVA